MTSVSHFLAGHDIFISYRWLDANKYAERLAEELEKRNLSCFLDKKRMHKGDVIDFSLKTAIRRSSMLVLIATENIAATDSIWVPQELTAFAASGTRKIVPIDVGGAMRSLPFGVEPWSVLKNRNSISETAENVRNGVIGDHVATEIEQAFTARRQHVVVKRKVLGLGTSTAAVVAMLTVWGTMRTIDTKRASAKDEIEALVSEADSHKHYEISHDASDFFPDNASFDKYLEDNLRSAKEQSLPKYREALVLARRWNMKDSIVRITDGMVSMLGPDELAEALSSENEMMKIYEETKNETALRIQVDLLRQIARIFHDKKQSDKATIYERRAAGIEGLVRN